MKPIGSTFTAELSAAGLSGLPFVWTAAGDIRFDSSMTQAQRDAVLAVYAAHDPAVAARSDMQKSLEDAVQQHLDKAAQARGYDDLRSAISYRGDANATWAHEADAFFAWRSQVWQTCLGMLSEVQQGLRPVPTADTLIASLPALVI